VTPPLDRIREYRCPACHALLGSTTRRAVTIGAPFVECGCGTYAPRPPFSEWDMLDSRAKVNVLGRGAVWLLSGMIPGLLYALGSILLDRSYSILGFLGAVGAGALLATAAWSTRLLGEIRRSRRRMGDPMYRAKLVEFGTQSRRP